MPLSSPAPPPAVRVRGLHVDLGGRPVVVGVDLDVSAGAVTVIAGPNGAGKSTLLDVIAGVRKPTSGSCEVDGTIAVVPQRTEVSERLPVTVRDVVTIGAWGRAGPWRRLDERARGAVDSALRSLEVDDLARRPFSDLSGGQRQRTLLAQALARGAGTLLLDEPTTGLDARSAERIRSVVRAEADRGVAVLCVSHDATLLGEADRVVRLADGRLESQAEDSTEA